MIFYKYSCDSTLKMVANATEKCRWSIIYVYACFNSVQLLILYLSVSSFNERALNTSIANVLLLCPLLVRVGGFSWDISTSRRLFKNPPNVRHHQVVMQISTWLLLFIKMKILCLWEIISSAETITCGRNSLFAEFSWGISKKSCPEAKTTLRTASLTFRNLASYI